MLMFTVMIPEEPQPQRKIHQFKILHEDEYFKVDKKKLAPLRCPNCGEHELFKGGVYIGCYGCFNYFSEADIVKANIGE